MKLAATASIIVHNISFKMIHSIASNSRSTSMEITQMIGFSQESLQIICMLELSDSLSFVMEISEDAKYL